MTDTEALTAARTWASEHGHQQPDDRMLRAYGAALLRDVAALIDRGPAIPLPPSIFSALVRERADDLTP
ncbi:hypothetical protein [Micromonospora sp. NPDC023814]|uniref:hypothetical protein n=1 Tax=Micromonospora sp. NPDC023814 TaxID=3154596 RepID=UPI003401BC59